MSSKPSMASSAAAKYMEKFYKFMDDVKILKDQIAYKRCNTYGREIEMLYTSEELLKQATALAHILNFRIETFIKEDERLYILTIYNDL